LITVWCGWPAVPFIDFLTTRKIVIYGIYRVDNVRVPVILIAGKEKPFTMIQLAVA
jgi:hypothetical protein